MNLSNKISPHIDYLQKREAHTKELADKLIELQSTIDEHEENNNDTKEFSWVNMSTDGDKCKLIIGFTPDEFLQLFDILEEHLIDNIGRGKKSKLTKQDRLVIVLCYLKHYDTIAKLAEIFSISKTYIHSILETTINSITYVLFNYYVVNVLLLIEDEEEYELFPNAKYVMDTTFQPIWTPLGTYKEKKQYYSGKHKMYGFKSQTIHDREGRVVNCIPGINGSVHDLTICRNNIDVLKALLNQDAEEEQHSVLVDLGYQGLQNTVSAVLPIKKKGNKNLTKKEIQYNKDLASQRVICERFYGRLKTKFRIMSSKYRNSRDDYKRIFALCVALTNFDIINHPL